MNPHSDYLHVEFSWFAARRDKDDNIALWEREMGGKLTGKPVPVKSRPKVQDQSPDTVPNGFTNFPDNYADLSINGNLLSWEIGALQILLENVVNGLNKQLGGEFEMLTVTVTDTMTRMQSNGY